MGAVGPCLPDCLSSKTTELRWNQTEERENREREREAIIEDGLMEMERDKKEEPSELQDKGI
jgi:hypothetical protein